MARCTVCSDPRRSEIELDKQNGSTNKELTERYGLTKRQVQYHFQHHYVAPKPDASVPELQDRLDKLVRQAETLLNDAGTASFGERTKAIGTLNSVLKTALQTAGMLKSLAPAQTATTNIIDSREYREVVAKVNEAVICPACREALKRVL